MNDCVMKIELHSDSPEMTESFAREISLWARPGQCILLRGDLGSGKSTFARALIRELSVDRAETDIPSPTFSIIQSYDNTRVPVAHVDLYRLQSEAEVAELGLDEIASGQLLMVEWPEKISKAISNDCLTVEFSGNEQKRILRIEAVGTWDGLLSRNAAINEFIAKTQFKGGVRSFFEGDASSRRYESIVIPGARALLMDMPKRPDGPIVNNNKPYSAIAHLAEDIRAVVGINDFLFKLGFSVPEVLDVDLAQGLALIEPLGNQVFGRMMLNGEDMRQPMMAAVEVLADMAMRDWPSEVPVRDAGKHRIENYDLPAMLIEVDLLPSWYWPYKNNSDMAREAHDHFTALWNDLILTLDSSHRVWTLRDYHSPNLLWMPEREGVQRVGLIDTQDCVMGFAAYDLVSMLQDARVDIDFDFADELFDYYCTLRTHAGDFDREVSFMPVL